MKNYNEYTTKELKAEAKAAKVANWWTLRKDELVAALTKKDEEFVEEVAQQLEDEENDREYLDAVNDLVNAQTEEVAEEKTEVKAKRNAKRGALIEWNGKAQNVCAWAKELGVNANTLYARLYVLNWGVEKTFTTAVKAGKAKA